MALLQNSNHLNKYLRVRGPANWHLASQEHGSHVLVLRSSERLRQRWTLPHPLVNTVRCLRPYLRDATHSALTSQCLPGAHDDADLGVPCLPLAPDCPVRLSSHHLSPNCGSSTIRQHSGCSSLCHHNPGNGVSHCFHDIGSLHLPPYDTKASKGHAKAWCGKSHHSALFSYMKEIANRCFSSSLFL